MQTKPSIFIASSKEALKIAYAIQENLEHDALCKVWTQGIFNLSGTALDNLIKAVEQCDFAVFMFEPDDILQIRDQTVRTVRDNIVFEFGLCIGMLGKERVFFLVPKESGDIHLPTDLIGIQPGHYLPQKKEEDLLSALGPFCNKLRRQIKNIWEMAEKSELEITKDTSEIASDESLTSENEQPSTAKQIKEVEYGIEEDEFGNFKLLITPTVFFDDRLGTSFPGLRGLQWFCDGKKAVDRLQILLKKPIKFDSPNPDPIWWWRGRGCLQIESFHRLSDTRCLIGIRELNINKIAVYRAQAYWQSFVYIEINPDQPIGLYTTDEVSIQERIKKYGYAHEEYGLFQNIPISRECFDDGAAVIDGIPIDTSGSELRYRYLSKYNFLIASKFSPINSDEFDEILEKLLDEMLLGKNHMEELCKIIENLPRHDNDIWMTE
ncbi:MAG TPA: nucleotide-binding protein [Thermoguttaceae bacterium]